MGTSGSLTKACRRPDCLRSAETWSQRERRGWRLDGHKLDRQRDWLGVSKLLSTPCHPARFPGRTRPCDRSTVNSFSLRARSPSRMRNSATVCSTSTHFLRASTRNAAPSRRSNGRSRSRRRQAAAPSRCGGGTRRSPPRAQAPAAAASGAACSSDRTSTPASGVPPLPLPPTDATNDWPRPEHLFTFSRAHARTREAGGRATLES